MGGGVGRFWYYKSRDSGTIKAEQDQKLEKIMLFFFLEANMWDNFLHILCFSNVLTQEN